MVDVAKVDGANHVRRFTSVCVDVGSWTVAFHKFERQIGDHMLRSSESAIMRVPSNPPVTAEKFHPPLVLFTFVIICPAVFPSFLWTGSFLHRFELGFYQFKPDLKIV